MKKILIMLVLVILTGCQNPAKNLQTNIFGDLWNKFVDEQNDDILVNRTTNFDSLNNYKEFYELNSELDSLREFLITGEYETAESPIPLTKIGNKYYIKDLNKIHCEEIRNNDDEIEKVNCFAQGETEKFEVACFNEENKELKYDTQKIKYCEFRGERKFEEGLMKIADRNNQELIKELQKSIKIFQEDTSSQKSLEKELKSLKKNVNRICKKQKSEVDCNLD